MQPLSASAVRHMVFTSPFPIAAWISASNFRLWLTAESALAGVSFSPARSVAVASVRSIFFRAGPITDIL